ncbi:MAG: HAD-IA family hydrolase [Candidatus Omnitrophica bacterium]|nr:HAD-IA family hydrolase [Candidatus Omnitrophota bacterium]
MKAIKAIFFDVDGTLADARLDIAGAMNCVLRTLERPEKTPDEISAYIGTGVKDLIRKSLGEDGAGLVDRATVLYEKEYLKHPADYAVLYPGVMKLLKDLPDKRKFILTNRYSHLASALLKKLGIRVFFEEVFGGDDEGCIKPSACVMDRILPAVRVDRKEALIVGDMAIDVMTGKNSGVRTCWVTYGLGKKEDVLPLEPDYVIDGISELGRIIK